MNSNLEKDLRELVDSNVISSQISNDIATFYANKKAQAPNKLFTIFGVLGSLLIGLGIILILAHNWDDFPRFMKTIWAFTPLVIGQLFVGYTLLKNKNQAWKETAATFLFFAIGACISLVSQIYHIPGSMPSFLLSWILLASPLIYLLRSNASTVLHLIFSTVYACNVGYFNDDSPWWYLAMLAWIVPQYYYQLRNFPQSNTTGILHWIFPLSILIVLGSFLKEFESIVFLIYVTLFGLFYNIGKLPFFEGQRLRKNGYLILGSVGMIVTLLFASFRWVWEEFDIIPTNIQDLLITGVLASISLGILLFLWRRKQIIEFNLFQFAFICFGIIYTTVFINSEVPIILTNILVFALGIFAIRIGSRKGLFSILNYGLLIITVLITCRFFDTDITFVIRGLLFVGIGVGFFAANYLMYKKQQQLNRSNHE